jgi:hypothetical protein
MGIIVSNSEIFPTPEKVSAMVDVYLAPLYEVDGKGRHPSEFRWQYGSENPLTLNEAEAGQWYLMSSSPSWANYRLLYVAENDQAGNWKLLAIDRSRASFDSDTMDEYGRTPTQNTIGYLGTAYEGDKETWDEWIWSSMDGWSKLGKGDIQSPVKVSQIGIINWVW